MVSTTGRVKLPPGIAVGRVIGKGGANTKAIVAKHGVRCFVNTDAGEAVVTGQRDKVEAAIASLEDLFQQLQMTTPTPRPKQQHSHRDASRVAPAILANAVVRKPGCSVWRFEKPAHGSVGDPNVQDFAYRLVSSTGEADGTAPVSRMVGGSWLHEFDTAFQQRMVEDAASFRAAQGSPVKLKAVFGMTCFSLLNPRVAKHPLTWDQLLGLKLYKDVKTRWANGCNTASAPVGSLVKKLQGLVTEETPFQTVLTVFINGRGTKKGEGMSVKFHLDGTEWIPMKHRPVRVVHGLYSVSLDDETAFRIRACSREPSAHNTLAHASLESIAIVPAPSGDVFQTTVVPGPAFPSTLEIRGFSVKNKTHIDAEGLRFTFSYMDAAHTDIKVECRLIPPATASDSETTSPPSETMRALLDKILALLND